MLVAHGFVRLSNTRFALPTDRSIAPGATIVMLVVTPMVFLILATNWSA